jgi:LmbE family N-acetylglucosaminyl deacetylase
LHHNNVPLEALKPLLGTTLVLVAHPDDEVIACGALMQRMKKAIVVFATDGAPRDQDFWKQYGSRDAYAEIRCREALLALGMVAATPVFLADQVEDGIADQELFLRLPAAVEAVERIISRLRPNCILTLAYEGGHPDHDAACFIAAMVGRRSGTSVWESPLYHRNAEGASVTQTFPHLTGNEVRLHADGEPLKKKIEMLQSYRSQGLLLDGFQPQLEIFRPLANYDFTQPPLPWKLNYEVWQWTMCGQEVAAAFADYLQNQGVVP